MSLLAQFEERGAAGERRGVDRRSLRLSIAASLPKSAVHAVTIHDLSESGLLLETLEPLAAGQDFEIILPLAGAVEATVVWVSGHFYGCQFRGSVPRAAVSAALLKSVPDGAEIEATKAHSDLLSRLRDLNERIERVRQDLDRTIAEFSERQAVTQADSDAERPFELEPARYAKPLPTTETDPTKPVVIISIILAGLAVLIFIAAILGLPLAS